MSPLANDVYNRSVVLNSNGITDAYTITDSAGNSFELGFPIGTDISQVYASINGYETIPTLPIAIADKIADFQTALQDFINSRYSIDVRFNFMALYVNAQQNLLVNRLAYISQIFTWTSSVITYASTFVASVNASPNIAAVAALKWNFSTLSNSDPKISPMAAIQILN